MTLASWFSLVVICCLGAVSPGPSLAVIIRISLSTSPLHGVVASITHGLGVGLWAILTMQGLTYFIVTYPTVFHWISVLGGIYLAWIGLKTLLNSHNSNESFVKAERFSLGDAARDGLMISLLNPKLALFFIALFSQFLAADMTNLDQLLIWATVVVIDSGWYVLVACLLIGGGLLGLLRRHQIWIERLMGMVLILLGSNVVFNSW